MDSTKHQLIDINGITFHFAEQGKEDDPLVLLIHGFPESWYSWRHQMSALAEAGYHVVALDMPGYGCSSTPKEIERFNQVSLSDDIIELTKALGYEEFIVVGHDYGAVTAWQCALRFPEHVKAVACMSIPYGGRPPKPPTQGFKRLFSDSFFYINYFQEVGVAEAELEGDIPKFLRSFLYSSSAENPNGFDSSGFPANTKLLEVINDPGKLPIWMKTKDFDFYVNQFETNGLSGPLSYYRNLDRTWQLSEMDKDKKIEQPALFIAGEFDPVVKFGGEYERMDYYVPNLKKITLPNCGHWTQQEAPDSVNHALLEFLKA
ncbi:MAG: alpha/beta hydrolase [Kangiellaceae bacterium]|nr:alpha/beta hydrolase [Kangiellaceae bacterium]